MQRSEIEDFLAGDGWTKDRFGHFKGELAVHGRAGTPSEGKVLLRSYRIKLSAISARVEMQLKLSDGNEWVRVAGDYYSKCRREGDRLLFGSMWIGKAVRPI